MSTELTLDPRVRKLLKIGIKHHQAGRRGLAEACYRRSLKADPRCPQTLHLLGLLAQQAGEYQKSIQWLEQSLALNPDDPETLKSLANAYVGHGQMEPACRSFQRLSDLFPQSAEAHHRLGKTQELLGDWEAATASYHCALTLQPDSPEVHGSLARLLCKQGSYAEAVESCRRSLALDPSQHEIYTQMGNALTDLEKYEAAVEAHRRALTLKPDSADAVFGLGYFFERKMALAAAVDAYLYALKLNPRLGAALLHLGIIYRHQGELAKAIACGERLRELCPDSPDARSLLALIHLQQGNFSLGFSEYEDRWKTSYGIRFRRKVGQQLWKGEPLEGARILLHAEQGMGDTLQFVRFVPLVAAQGGKVILEVQPRLRRLLAQTPGAVEVICPGEPTPAVDWQCPLLSLPRALGTELSTIPARVPYLSAEPVQATQWSERLRKDSFRIGLAWGGNPVHPDNRWRSIPLAQLATLLEIPGTTFYSLQMGPGTEQLGPMAPHRNLIDLAGAQKDFADTAAIVASLDLVVSIDSAVAHLTGAMGRPIWILLYKSPDWRWLLGREDSPWYPTARLFRQSTLGNWQDVVARVESALRELVAKTAVASGNKALPG